MPCCGACGEGRHVALGLSATLSVHTSTWQGAGVGAASLGFRLLGLRLGLGLGVCISTLLLLPTWPE